MSASSFTGSCRYNVVLKVELTECLQDMCIVTQKRWPQINNAYKVGNQTAEHTRSSGRNKAAWTMKAADWSSKTPPA